MSENYPPPQMFPLGTAVYAEREGKILLLKRSAESGYGGQWFLPGGAVDPGEGPYEAAVRELREESALEVVGELELVGAYLSHIYGHDFLMLSYRGEVTGEVEISHEHDGAQWVDPLDMRAFMSDDQLAKIAEGNERAGASLTRIRDDLDLYLRKIGRSSK